MKHPEELGLAILGYGSIGRLHALNYAQLPYIYPGAIPRPHLRWVATSRKETARAAAAEAGADRWTTSLTEIIADAETVAVDVSLPNHLHRDAVIALMDAGKHVYCEKPLAGTLEDAHAIARAVGNGAGIFAMTFQYRFVPAILQAARLIQAGRIGRVYTFRGEYLHSGYQNPDKPLSWRMRKDQGGSGALGDLGSHVIDLVRFLLGDIAAVQGHLETFVDRRPVAPGAAETGTVTVDDVAWIRCRLAGGAVGTIEASRFATGTLDDLRLWVYGEHGALHFSLMDPNFLWFFDARASGPARTGGTDSAPAGSGAAAVSGAPAIPEGWQRLHTGGHFPGAKTPPGRAPMGWARSHGENQYRFLRAVAARMAGHRQSDHIGGPDDNVRDHDRPDFLDAALPGIADGLAVQYVLDATERSHTAGGVWTDVTK
jgi:predicted dehydrogenase